MSVPLNSQMWLMYLQLSLERERNINEHGMSVDSANHAPQDTQVTCMLR